MRRASSRAIRTSDEAACKPKVHTSRAVHTISLAFIMFITILIDLVELKIGCKINKFFTHHREQIPILKVMRRTQLKKMAFS